MKNYMLLLSKTIIRFIDNNRPSMHNVRKVQIRIGKCTVVPAGTVVRVSCVPDELLNLR